MKYSYSSSSSSISISIPISISKNMSLSMSMSLLVSDLSLKIENLCSVVVKDICSRNCLSYDIEWCEVERLLKGGDVDVSVAKQVAESVAKPVAKPVAESVAVSVAESVSCESRIALPFSGEMYNDRCRGLKYNNGLMTQCKVRVGDVGVDELKYCKTCENQSKKNGHCKPTYGTIKDRLKCDIYDYVAPNGERPISYVSVMSKLNLSKECVLEESKRCGQKIDERHFDINEGVVPEKRSRGRPKSNVNTDSNKSSVKGRRGRPKKDSKVLELSGGDDLLSALVSNSVAETVSDLVDVEAVCSDAEIVVDSVAESVAVQDAETDAKSDAELDTINEGEEVEEEETDVVIRVEIDNKKYLKSKKSGVIYDASSHEEIGVWNEKKQIIDYYADDNEEEEYEEYEDE